MSKLMSLTHLSDGALVGRLENLLQRDNESLAEFLRVLGEVDRRRLYAELGYSSLFQYCVELLHLSESQTWLRIQAMRSARQFPLIIDMVQDGRLHLTAIGKLAPHLTAENHRSLLLASVHKSKRQIELLLAEKFPKPDVGESIRRLPNHPTATQILEAARAGDTTQDPRSSSNAQGARTSTSQPSADRIASPSIPDLDDGRRSSHVEPLSPHRYAVRLTVSQKFHDLLKEAKDLSSHAHPNADASQVLEEALETYVESLRKRRAAKTDQPRKSSPEKTPKPDSRHIPNAEKRIVYERDGGMCTYVSPDGHRCNETAFVEYDHVKPFANGGSSTADNLRLLCSTHNRLMADREFGEPTIQLSIQGFSPQAKKERISTSSGRG